MEKDYHGNNFTQKFDLRDAQGREQTVELKIHNHSLDIMFHTGGEDDTEESESDTNVGNLVSVDFWEGKLTIRIITPAGEQHIELSNASQIPPGDDAAPGTPERKNGNLRPIESRSKKNNP